MHSRSLKQTLSAALLGVCLIAAACGGENQVGPTGEAQGPDQAAEVTESSAAPAPTPAIAAPTAVGASPSETTDDPTPAASPAAPSTIPPVPLSRPDAAGLPVAGLGENGPLTSTAAVLQEANPRITAVVYPRPEYDGDPWSQWGQGVILDDGRVISAIGDHLGRGGNSYLFEYDPTSGQMSRVGDIAEALNHPASSWGFGKVHGQMVLANDGDVYFSTYWGSRRGIEFDDSYRGDVLLRLDPDSFELTSLGVPVDGHGVPSLASDGRYLYGEALDPLADPTSGGLFVYDTREAEVVRWLPDERHARFRNVIVDRDGAMVATAEGGLLRYLPGATSLAETPIELGDQLRASSAVDRNGVVYAVTNREHRLVAIEANATIRDLGNAPAYTTSLALLPDESGFLFVPGARGDAPELGASLISVDGKTGVQTIVAALADPVEAALGLTLGGSYNVMIDVDRGVAHIGFNAGTDPEVPWGEVVLVSVELDPAHQALPAPASPVVEATEAFNAVDPLLGIRGHAIAVADVNDDGWDDIFVGTFADRPTETYQVRGADGPAPDRLLLGGPDGFRQDHNFPGRLARTAGAAFADLDDDGDPDLIVSRNVRRESYGTEILRNDDGNFVSMGVLDDARGGRAVDTLDYDGDGRLDIFLVEDRWVGGSSVLFHNDGDLAFSDTTASSGLPNDVFGLGLGIADLDGNGADDLVIGGSNRIFLGDGRGGFTESVDAIAEWEIYGPEDDVDHVAIGDIDRDGRPDIVLGHHYNSTVDFGEEVPVRLYLNRGTSPDGQLRLSDVTTEAGLIPLPTKAPKVLLADLNGDGWLDIVTTASADGGTQPAIFFHRGLVNGIPQFDSPKGLGDAQYWIDGAVVDVDRDGDDDLFLVEWEPAIGSLLFRNDL